MIYRKLGKKGPEVGAIALGCEGFSGKTQDETNRMMRFAVSQGINFLDLYASDPDLRSRIGNALRDADEPFFIQGHVGSIWKNGQYERSRNLDEVEPAFCDLLKRLGRDFVDVGMIHYVDAEDDFRNVFDGPFIEFVKGLKKSGAICRIGLSSHNPVVAKAAVETGLIDVLLFSVNPCYDMQPPDEDVEMLWEKKRYAAGLHNFNAEREALYELCARNGVGIDVMKVYGGGDLLNAELSPFKRAFTPVQALNYALTRPAVAAVMVGCASVEEIAQAVAWCGATEQEKDYSRVLDGLEKFTWSGRCMYCGHCAPCPAGIDVADVNKFLNLALVRDSVPETVREHYKALKHHASDCIQCGACETRCPFSVPVRSRMRDAARVFGF